MRNIKSLIDPEAQVLMQELLAGITSTGEDTLDEIKIKAMQKMSDVFGSTEGKIVSEDVYVKNEDDGSDILVKLYRPTEKPDDKLPLLYYIHGGGMIRGSASQDDTTASILSLKLGVMVASVDYRLATVLPYPTPIKDCYSGLNWLVKNAEILNIDENNVGIFGLSAGGGLAIATTLLCRERGFPKIKFQAPIYPMIDHSNQTKSSHTIVNLGIWDRKINKYAWATYLAGQQPDHYSSPSLLNDFSNLPPTYTDIGALDLFRDETITFMSSLMQETNSVEMHVYPGVFHGMEIFIPHAQISRQIWDNRIAALKRLFGSKQT